MSLRFTLFCLALLAFLFACRLPKTNKTQEFSAYFHPLGNVDTLHVEISSETAQLPASDTIPNALFFKTIPHSFLQEIDYIADSSESIVIGRQFFRLSPSVTAYWVEIWQFWFQNHSLFLYDNQKKAFTGRITLAEWYGGDGGQILVGSWLFDFDGDGKKDIVRREIQHAMIPNGEEVEERTANLATLYLWKNGRFVETAVKDTTGFVKRYPIRSFWE